MGHIWICWSNVEEEVEYLRSNIYSTNADIPLEIEMFDAFNKYSIIDNDKEYIDNKYKDKLIWAKGLQKVRVN